MLRWWVPVAVSVIALAGCATPGSALEKSPEITVTTVGVALRDPVWSYRNDALVGLTDDGRVAEITDLPGRATSRLSPPIAVGRNLQISRKDDRHVFVPEPQHGKVAVMDLATLRVSHDSTGCCAVGMLGVEWGVGSPSVRRVVPAGV